MTIKSIKLEKNKSFILELLKNMYWKYRKYTKIGILSFKIAHQSKHMKVLIKAIKLYRSNKFLPQEAFQLGLLNGQGHIINKYLSRKQMTVVQKSINPLQWEMMTEDKGIFYKYCIAEKLPIPKLFAIFFKETAGWTYDGSVLTDQSDWENFISYRLPSEFVIKPTRGVYGRSLYIFRKFGKALLDSTGRQCEFKNIYEMMSSDQKYDSFVIQERLKNDSEIMRLTASESLQTVRAITFVDKKKKIHILLAHLKLVAGNNLIDNTDNGRSGNMQALISLDEGVLQKAAVKMTSNGSGHKEIFYHPRTGLPFEGFKVPLWHELRNLVEDAAAKFLPIRTIGWDVALTPNGPIIVEANMFWDPPNGHGKMDLILPALLESQTNLEKKSRPTSAF